MRLLYMQYLPGGSLEELIKFVQATPPDERTGALFVEAVDAALARPRRESHDRFPTPEEVGRNDLAASRLLAHQPTGSGSRNTLISAVSCIVT